MSGDVHTFCQLLFLRHKNIQQAACRVREVPQNPRGPLVETALVDVIKGGAADVMTFCRLFLSAEVQLLHQMVQPWERMLVEVCQNVLWEALPFQPPQREQPLLSLFNQAAGVGAPGQVI